MDKMYTSDIIDNDIRILNSIRIPMEFADDIVPALKLVINDLHQLKQGLIEYASQQETEASDTEMIEPGQS